MPLDVNFFEVLEREYTFSKDTCGRRDWKSPRWNLFLHKLDYFWIACLVSPESMGGKWCVKAKLFFRQQLNKYSVRFLDSKTVVFGNHYFPQGEMNILQGATGTSFTPLFQTLKFFISEPRVSSWLLFFGSSNFSSMGSFSFTLTSYTRFLDQAPNLYMGRQKVVPLIHCLRSDHNEEACLEFITW